MSAENELTFTPGAVKKATEGCKSADLWKVAPSRLKRAEGFNVRIINDAYKERVREYAESFKANGYYLDKPMAGYVAKVDGEDVIYITDGHTRMDAIELAASEGTVIEFVSVVTKPAGTSMEDLDVALVVGNAGRPLTPYETAIVVKRLMSRGLDEKEIATRLGVTLTHIQNMLTIMAAPLPVRKLIEADKISFTTALTALREHGADAARVLKESMSAAEEAGHTRMTPKHMKAASKGGDKPVKVSKPVIVRSVEWLRTNQLDSDDRFLKFLAYLGGLEDASEVLKLADEASSKAKKGTAKAKPDNSTAGGS